MAKEVIDCGFCNKVKETELGTSKCGGILTARPKLETDNLSMEYLVNCDTCHCWWETDDPLKMMVRRRK